MARLRGRLWTVLALGCLARAGYGLAPEPEQVLARCRELTAGRPHLFVRTPGVSSRGRSIGLVIATARPQALVSQVRVLVLARQHGDEPVPARAALLWLAQQGQQASAFERVAVLLVPTLNPDGAAAGTRANGAGVDLNRDWSARTQPETRLVETLYQRWRPHMVVDMHTFPGLRADGTRGEPDWLESFRVGGDTPADRVSYDLASELVSVQRAVNEPVRLIQTRREEGWPATLCHRYFAQEHRVPALLWEIGDDRADPEARLLTELVGRLAARAERLKPLLDQALGWRDWRPAETLPVVAAKAAAPRPADPPRPYVPPSVPWSWCLAACAAVLAPRAKGPWSADEME